MLACFGLLKRFFQQHSGLEAIGFLRNKTHLHEVLGNLLVVHLVLEIADNRRALPLGDRSLRLSKNVWVFKQVLLEHGWRLRVVAGRFYFLLADVEHGVLHVFELHEHFVFGGYLQLRWFI